MKFVVWQKFYDTGKVEAGIKEMTEEEFLKLNHCETKERYDIYYDSFDTFEQAEEFRKEALQA